MARDPVTRRDAGTGEGGRAPRRAGGGPAGVPRHDWSWYRQLSVALAEHAPLDVSGVRCPVTFLAGRFDSLVDVADVRKAAHSIPGARFREILGTHFLPLQYPEIMIEEMTRLSGRKPGH